MKMVMPVVLAVLMVVPLSIFGQQEGPAPGASIHLAALQGNIDTIRQYIRAGSDLNQRDAYGSTPLIIAVTFGRTEAARLLIEAGADTTIGNNDGSTPLHIAALFCRTGIVKALLDHGADRYTRNNAGNTALDTVAAPFDDVRAVYDIMTQALGPLGLVLDYDQVREARPRIARMLRPRPEELAAVDFEPLSGGGWKVSTPAEQGLDPLLVAELYRYAAEVETLYGLLIVKNGKLVAERYFNGGGIDQLSGRQSVTKSYVSALVGIALDKGCLSTVDQRMIDFFPEFAGKLDDPRKERITIRDLLEMRAGYPDEQRTPPWFDRLFLSEDWHWVAHIADFPLMGDPGTGFRYSNLTSHLLGIIVARACGSDLASFAQKHLFSPIGAEVGGWSRDADGYNFGCNEIYVTARDMARFGLLYLNDGQYEGRRVVPAAWVRESLQAYSEGMFDNQWHNEASRYPGPYFRDIRYGYQWWSARVDGHRFSFAWGHGGSLIILLHELDMVVVTTADPLYELPGEEGWKHEGAVINLVGKFIRSLPEG